MAHDQSRLSAAIVDPSHFGQSVLFDLLCDEGVRTIAKFASGREFLNPLQTEQFDLVLVDDGLPDFSAVELLSLAKAAGTHVPKFIALQSALNREDVAFLRECGVGGVLLKPIAPKRFSAVFRSIFQPMTATSLAA